MAGSGSCTVTPGAQLSVGQRLTRALANLLGRPTVRIDEGAVGERELNQDDVLAAAARLGLPNLLINGNFDLWQRGGYVILTPPILPATFGASADAEFTADRWRADDPPGVNYRSIYRGSFDTGQTQVPNEPTYYLRWEQLIGQTDPTLSQGIEDVRTMAGKTVTVSGWIKSDTGGTIKVGFKQYYGGSPSPVVAIAEQNVIITGGAVWAKHELHFNIPDLVYGGSPTGADSSLRLYYEMPSSAEFTTDFAQIKVEEGGNATAFMSLTPQQEKAACERYFEYSGGVMATDQANIQTVAFPIQLASMTTAAADLVTNYVPGYKFEILAVNFITTTIGTGAGATQTINLEIGTTDVTGGVVNPTLSSTDTLGKITAGSAITAGNTGTSSDSISIEVAAGGTVFTAGEGTLFIKLQNLEGADLTQFKPCFYFATRKYKAPTLTLVSGYAGTGGTFVPILDTGYYQDTANSELSLFFIAADAEIGN